MVKKMLLPSTIELAQHLNSKICHDYANSINTIDNCITLISNKNKDIGQKANELLKSESNYLILATSFYRSAYGSSNDDKTLSSADLSKNIEGYLNHKNIKLTVAFSSKKEFIDNNLLKIIMTISDLVRDSLFNGGDLLIESNDDAQIKMIGYSEKPINAKEKNLSIISGESDEVIDVMNCREHYLNVLISKSAYNVSINHDEKILSYNLKK